MLSCRQPSGAGGGRAPKPAPDALHAVFALVAREASGCIFVGDSDLDYRVARVAGLPFAFMTYGYADAGWQPHSDNDWHDTEGESFDTFDHLVEALLAGVAAGQFANSPR